MRKLASALMLMLLLITVSALGHSFKAVMAQYEQWVPYIPNADYVELGYREEKGISYIGVSITFASSGFNVSDWGTPLIVGGDISVDADVWMWTGVSLPVVIKMCYTYDLGRLPTGKYVFTFEAWGFPVESISFTSSIVVPDTYATIQEAINNANEGDMIYVKAGTYTEYALVNKSLSLFGEDERTTVIDGNGTFDAIIIVTANNVTISGFTIQNNAPVHCFVGGGIYVIDANGTTILDNTLRDDQYAINLNNSANNTIVGNTLGGNDVGVQFLECYLGGSSFYHNNFIDNGQHVRFVESNCSNSWNNGYLLGGNYWSDHNPPDEYSRPYQNVTGSDGIGDMPYAIDMIDVDRYPLIYPYGFVPSPDINEDGIVDLFDLILIALKYGVEPGFPIWNPYCDMNRDGIIDIFDLIQIASDFGKTWNSP